MMKSFVTSAVEENMSNLTSASNEASASSVTRNDSGNMPPQLYDFAAPIQHQAQPTTTTTKKKRNLPGNPDPESEVIALSPKTLMATNRFLCEICNKGFQRDQNLQLHRRGHNLPWKLKQRTSKEIRKKVYVCPEVSCVHHEPSRALGDLTGIKKHFCRKHGEKKWKCDKCSKRYAVQSDWKAHSKTCGTREYRCDCGTLFSRRDSFITHRAFCDALAEESTRAITGGGNQHQQLLPSPVAVAVGSSSSSQHFQFTSNHHHDIPLQIFAPLKKEHHHHNFTLRPPEIPPWLSCPQDLSNSSLFHSELNQEFGDNDNNNPSSTSSALLGPNNLPSYLQANSPHMSATALLQKAAQMGATMSMNSKTCSLPAMLRPHQAHESVNSTTTIGNFGTTTTVNNLSSREEQLANRNATFVNGLVGGVANKAAAASSAGTTSGPPPSMLQDMMMMNSLSSSGFEGTNSSSFEDAFGGIFKEEKNQMLFHHQTNEGVVGGSGSGGGGGGGGQDSSSTMGGMTTRDFLGLRPLSQNDIFLNIAALGNCMNNGGSNHHDQNATTTNQESWPHGH